MDIACGTGEPGLTLLGRYPGLQLIGIDASEATVAIAARKASGTGARYDVMSSDRLELADESVDAVVSRFGLLSFAPDPRAEAREVARVLRPGGAFSIATWDAGSKNIITYALTVSLRPWLGPPVLAAVERSEHFAMPGRRERWLTEAGLAVAGSELFTWSVEFAGEEDLWEFANDPVFLGTVTGGLDSDRLAEVRRGLLELLADYRSDDGSYALPYACRVLSGARPA
ncbi:class I SAM-dependent methyltransferase [Cryptosporangium phraense]|uniref:Class I SAM-dependent methyltransferase n=1 Tax=Cryptosporangium phraense TaxID=2593070 RepID=A0A545AUR5_9ACTN|nr:class I SAM-dependent methyltransferase [Cryptosporangium phraense]TQS45080.1 class I SAM-dependent methyltransferase [Cryptosporangium phraense]